MSREPWAGGIGAGNILAAALERAAVRAGAYFFRSARRGRRSLSRGSDPGRRMRARGDARASGGGQSRTRSPRHRSRRAKNRLGAIGPRPAEQRLAAPRDDRGSPPGAGKSLRGHRRRRRALPSSRRAVGSVRRRLPPAAQAGWSASAQGGRGESLLEALQVHRPGAADGPAARANKEQRRIGPQTAALHRRSAHRARLPGGRGARSGGGLYDAPHPLRRFTGLKPRSGSRLLSGETFNFSPWFSTAPPATVKHKFKNIIKF